MPNGTMLTFAVVAFATVAIPGPTVMLAMNSGSRLGLRMAVFGMAGALMSDFVLIGAVALGLGGLMATSDFLFSVVRWIGVFYLGYLGFVLLTSTGSIDTSSSASQGSEKRSPWHLFVRSFLVAVTNPKGYIFFAAFLPQFLDLSQPLALQYTLLAMIFGLIDLVVMLAYALLGVQTGRLLAASQLRVIDRVCGIILLTLAISLALYRN